MHDRPCAIWDRVTGHTDRGAKSCMGCIATQVSAQKAASPVPYGDELQATMFCHIGTLRRVALSEDLDLASRRRTQRERRLLDVLARLFGAGAFDHHLEQLALFFRAIQTAQRREHSLPLLALARLLAVADEHRERREAVAHVAEPLRQLVVELEGDDGCGGLLLERLQLRREIRRAGLRRFL